MLSQNSVATLPNDLAIHHTHPERRQNRRVSTNLFTTLRRASAFLKPRMGQGIVSSYSKSGAYIQVNQALDIGEWVSLSIYDTHAPTRRSNKLKQRAIVVREISNEESKKYDTRCEDCALFHYAIRFGKGYTCAWSYLLYRLFPLMVLLLFIAGIANVLFLKNSNITYFWYSPVFNLYSVLISVYILSRFALAMFYRAPKDNAYLPSISVIVSCKNEEDSIYKTLECIYQSDYIAQKMDVITVNDGSTDNTLAEMQRAQRNFPSLHIIDFPKNLGKRFGMAEGARAAKGEILIYIDSDSFVRRDTFRKLVRGFSNPNVGAVCGHANVQNARANLLTKMQEVRYFVAFRDIKAAESLLSTVSCCSGCLAAYRRSYVMPILDTWLNQHFLGTQATFGDDRSLTNFMLRRFRVIYDADAVCSTLVPEQYRVFFRQQLRWKKSWIRESLIGSTFMWRRHPLAAFFYYLGVLFPIVAPIIVLNALLLPLAGIGSVSYLYIYGVVLMASMYGLVYLGRYRDSLWMYGITFSVFYMTVLVWQTYYALLTVRRNHWGTR